MRGVLVFSRTAVYDYYLFHGITVSWVSDASWARVSVARQDSPPSFFRDNRQPYYFELNGLATIPSPVRPFSAMDNGSENFTILRYLLSYSAGTELR